MKRLALAVSLMAFVACKKAEQTPPAADTTAAPAAAPAPAMDSSKMMDSTKKMMDTTKMAHPRDTSKAGMKGTKKPS